VSTRRRDIERCCTSGTKPLDVGHTSEALGRLLEVVARTEGAPFAGEDDHLGLDVARRGLERLMHVPQELRDPGAQAMGTVEPDMRDPARLS
jgi:hypothetical protein